MQPLIRETSEGVEVAKVNSAGEYEGYHSIVSPDSFEIHDKEENVLASFEANTIELGKGNSSATISMVDDNFKLFHKDAQGRGINQITCDGNLTIYSDNASYGHGSMHFNQSKTMQKKYSTSTWNTSALGDSTHSASNANIVLSSTFVDESTGSAYNTDSSIGLTANTVTISNPCFVNYPIWMFSEKPLQVSSSPSWNTAGWASSWSSWGFGRTVYNNDTSYTDYFTFSSDGNNLTFKKTGRYRISANVLRSGGGSGIGLFKNNSIEYSSSYTGNSADLISSSLDTILVVNSSNVSSTWQIKLRGAYIAYLDMNMSRVIIEYLGA